MTDADEKQAARLEVHHELVRRGVLTQLLHEDQRRVRQQMRETMSQQFVLEIARRWGKTWLMVVDAIETCLQNPGCRVPYGSSTDKSLREFILPTIAEVTKDFPPDCMPSFNSFDGHLTFPNGSHIHLFGCEDALKARRGRGPPARRVYLDECGFIPIALDVVENVLRPQTMRLQPEDLRCSVVLGSSPAEEPDHQFTQMAEVAEAHGAFARRTIYDNPLLSPEQVENFIAKGAEARGMSVEEYKKTDTFRREYLAERVIDKLLVCVPEWAEVRSTQLVAVPRPDYFDGMVVIDWGGFDPHFVHLAYWHFPLAGYVIERELMMRNNENTEELVRACKQLEQQTWGTDRWAGTLKAFEDPNLVVNLPAWLQGAGFDAPPQPRSRWCDNNNIALARDFHQLHGYSVIPTGKDSLNMMTNASRILVAQRKLFVHPSCVHTDRHLRTTTWQNHNRNEFARKAGEHGDGLACINYGVKNADRQRNPQPMTTFHPLLGHRPVQQKTLAERLGEVMKG